MMGSLRCGFYDDPEILDVLCDRGNDANTRDT